MNIIEYCCNCKHKVGGLMPQCQHPDNGIDRVTGQVDLVPCRVARSKLSGFCGPYASLFEPRAYGPPPSLPWYKALWAWIIRRY